MMPGNIYNYIIMHALFVDNFIGIVLDDVNNLINAKDDMMEN